MINFDEHKTEPLTIIYTWKVKKGYEKQFEELAHDITAAANRYPGHMGATYLRPLKGSNKYHTVVRFSNNKDF